MILKGDYLRTIEIWESYYPPEQIFYAFTEDIARRPRGLLLDIYKFIGVAASDLYIPKQAEKKVTKSVEYEIPDVVYKYLTEFYYEPIKQLAERFSFLDLNYAEEWLEKAEKVLCPEEKVSNDT